MKFQPTQLPGVYTIGLNQQEDERGVFVKTYNEDVFKSEAGAALDWRESFYSVSKKNVIRGMHFQVPPFDNTKIVYVTAGKIRDVVLDIRRSSPAFGRHIAVDLSADRADAIYIPAGCAHGFLSLTDNATVIYLQTSVYSAQHDKGILWSSFGMNWGVTDPVLSPRDRAFPALATFETPFN
ncbi:MAG: dTDP-4-dehydrorhamnose 3,5-epimerase family protein [Smithellaceae bacterium]